MRYTVLIVCFSILATITGLTVWRVIYYENQIAPRATALRIGEFLIPLPIGTQVVIDGGRVHCNLIVSKGSNKHQVGVVYAKGDPDDIVRARKANGWLILSPLQEDPTLSSEILSVQSVVFTKSKRQLGYHFVRPKHGGRQAYLVLEWLCDEKNCAEMQSIVQQLMRLIEVH